MTTHRKGRARPLAIAGAAILALGAILYIAFGPGVSAPDPIPTVGSVIAAYDPWTPRDVSGFVGSKTCRDCHAEIAEQYAATHPMSLAMRPVNAAEEIEASDGEVTTFRVGAGREYDIIRRGDRMEHIERGIDDMGEPIYEQGHEVKYVLGSGARGRSYVVERNGQLFASPITWYSMREKWGLAPGYERGVHPRFDRWLGERCLGCHSGRRNFAEPPVGEVAKFEQPLFLEHGIGCERCHGPGKDHVDFHRAPAIGGAVGKDPIVNPVELSAARRDAVCNQCHLQGEFLFYRPGRTDSDFRPGDLLSDIWLIYSKIGAEGVGSDDAVRQPEQMYASVCFQESGGKMSCMSCHDPHSRPAEDEVAKHYRARCLTCHADEGCSETQEKQNAAPASGSCIHCHMPRRAASDIPHTSQTDHRILRQPNLLPSATPLMPKAPTESELKLFHPDEQPLAKAVADRAEGLKLSRLARLTANQATRQDMAARAIENLKVAVDAAPQDAEAWQFLARAQEELQRYEEARKSWQAIVAAYPDLALGHRGLYDLAEKELAAIAPLGAGPVNLTAAQAARRTTLLAESERAVIRLIEIEPWNADWWLERAIVLEAQGGKTAEAAKSAEKAIELDPTEPQAYPLTINLFRRLGRFDEAKALEDRARRFLAAELARQEPPQAGGANRANGPDSEPGGPPEN